MPHRRRGRSRMRMFFSTKTHFQGTEQDTATISDSDGSSVFITEADWHEIGKMKGWHGPPDDEDEDVDEIPILE